MSRPLPGRTFVPTGCSLERAFHRDRPWVAWRKTPVGEDEFHFECRDLDTDTAIELYPKPVRADAVVWHGDALVARFRYPGDFLGLVDATGQGLLRKVPIGLEWRVEGTETRGQATIVWLRETDRGPWQGVRFCGDPHGDLRVDRWATYAAHRPAWHPDGHAVALFRWSDLDARWTLVVESRDGESVETRLPVSLCVLDKVVLAWGGPDTVTLLDVSNQSEHILWLFSVSSRTFQRVNSQLAERWGVEKSAIRGGWLNNDGTRFVFILRRETHRDLALVDLTTGTHATFGANEHGAITSYVSEVLCLDAHTLMTMQHYSGAEADDAGTTRLDRGRSTHSGCGSLGGIGLLACAAVVRSSSSESRTAWSTSSAMR